MTEQEIDELFERTRSWPLARREEAAQILLWMHEREREPYVLSPEEERALEEGEASGVASDEEVTAFFQRYPRPIAAR